MWVCGEIKTKCQRTKSIFRIKSWRDSRYTNNWNKNKFETISKDL